MQLLPEETSPIATANTGRSSSDDQIGHSGYNYVMQPLLTEHDHGEPGSSLAEDIRRVSLFIKDERILVACDLYESVMQRIEDFESKEATSPKSEKKETEKAPSRWGRRRTKQAPSEDQSLKADVDMAKSMLAEKTAEIQKLRGHALLLRKAKQNVEDDDDWTFVQTLFGITTLYRREDDGSLSIKLEGDLKGNLFEQVAVLREIDLNSRWAPFCSSSLTIAFLDKLDVVGWFLVGLPSFGIARDCCFRSIGSDCTLEDGSIVLAGQGLNDRPEGSSGPEDTYLADDPCLKTLDMPPVPRRTGSGRMTMKTFNAVVKVLANDHCRTKVVANIDPNLMFVPQKLLEFVMKRLCGLLLTKLQGAAKKAYSNPVKNVHAQRIREDPFYRGWLLPKFKAFCRKFDWEVPLIPALAVSESEHLRSHRSNLFKGNTVASPDHKRGASFGDIEGAQEGPENSSTRSDPGVVIDHEIMDTISDISDQSETVKSVWSNNPISAYLKEMEEKTQRRKQAEVFKSRQKAEQLLKPKEFSSERKERLQELKLHKQKRMASRGFPTVPVSDRSTQSNSSDQLEAYEVPMSFSQRLTSSLHHHGKWTRVVVVTFLLILLFAVLHMDDLFYSFVSPMFELGNGLLVFLLRDAATILFIVFGAVVHFVLCDVILVYAFEALELGMKTGNNFKLFYSSNVRTGVALFSVAIVGISIVKAEFFAWAEAWMIVLVDVLRSMNYIKGFMTEDAMHYANSFITEDVMQEIKSIYVSHIQAHVPSAVVVGWHYVLSTYLSLVAYNMSVLTYLLSSSSAFLSWGLLRFGNATSFGQDMTTSLRDLLGTLEELSNELIDEGSGTFDFQRLEESLSTWRLDAIKTSRSLMLYSAVFLLAILIFFNILVSSYRYDVPDDVIEEPTLVDEMGSLDFFPIKEEESERDLTLGRSSSKQRHWPRFGRFRRRRSNSDFSDEEGEASLTDPLERKASNDSSSAKAQRERAATDDLLGRREEQTGGKRTGILRKVSLRKSKTS